MAAPEDEVHLMHARFAGRFAAFFPKILYTDRRKGFVRGGTDDGGYGVERKRAAVAGGRKNCNTSWLPMVFLTSRAAMPAFSLI